jgi:serine/threonine protein kinase
VAGDVDLWTEWLLSPEEPAMTAISRVVKNRYRDKESLDRASRSTGTRDGVRDLIDIKESFGRRRSLSESLAGQRLSRPVGAARVTPLCRKRETDDGTRSNGYATWARLRREALARRVGHPGVCAPFDVGEERGVPFIVSERLRGETLAEAIMICGPLPFELVVSIFVELASALHAIHDAGVIHREIKPSNIFLVRREGCRSVPRFSDFGCAAEIERQSDDAVFGTPAYMRPSRRAATPSMFEPTSTRSAFRSSSPSPAGGPTRRGATNGCSDPRRAQDLPTSE